MYQAIVFLPLLGAILAGLIALVGARARFPGQGPAPVRKTPRHDHGPHHGAPGVHGGAVIHSSHHEEDAPSRRRGLAHGRTDHDHAFVDLA